MTSSSSSRFLELMLLVGTLLFSVVAAVIADRPDLIWDEARYEWYAKSITHGTYATDEKSDIINGPGYPLVLAPLVALQVPLLGQRMLNGLFMALAVWFTFRGVSLHGGRRWGLVAALVTGFHPALVRTAPYLMTEALACCCIAGFLWAISAVMKAEKWRWGAILAAAFAFGWLTLTRVFFGNVILAALVFLVVLMAVWKSQRDRLARATVVLGLALGMCVPWLAYTHSRTGQMLCWSTAGGELLYWATSHHEGENGHWFAEEDALNKPELVANHREFYLKNYYLPVLEREAALKKKAMENLRSNPKAVLKNWACNWSRLAFNFPQSFRTEELAPVALILFNAPLLLALVLTGYVAFYTWRDLPAEVVVLALLSFIYVGGTSLLPGLPRYLAVIIPWLLAIVAGVCSRGLQVRIGTVAR